MARPDERLTVQRENAVLMTLTAACRCRVFMNLRFSEVSGIQRAGCLGCCWLYGSG